MRSWELGDRSSEKAPIEELKRGIQNNLN